MSRMGVVHAIHGYLAVGKTTFARRLHAERGGVVLSLDEWTIGLSRDRTHLDPELFDRTWLLLSDLWPQIATAGADVILDFGFWSRASRDDARERAERAGLAFHLYSLVCDEATAISRCQARTEDDAYILDRQAYAELRNKFEPLGPDEPAEVVPTE